MTDGYIRAANIITPTNANAGAIDFSLKQVAARSIRSGQVDREKLEHVDQGFAGWGGSGPSDSVPCYTFARGQKCHMTLPGAFLFDIVRTHLLFNSP